MSQTSEAEACAAAGHELKYCECRCMCGNMICACGEKRGYVAEMDEEKKDRERHAAESAKRFEDRMNAIKNMGKDDKKKETKNQAT